MAWLTLRPALEEVIVGLREDHVSRALLAIAVIDFEEEAARSLSPGRDLGTNGKTKCGSEGLAEDFGGVDVVGRLKGAGDQRIG